MTKNEGFFPNTDLNVWLRSCEKEVIEPLKTENSGAIPSWLNGCLLRNGPGSWKVGNDYFQHLFDCSSLLHRFGIQNGQVTYQCRFLQSNVYKKNKAANRIVLTEFGTQAVPDPCRSIFQRVASIFYPNSENVSDNSMISLYPFGDEIYAFGEIPVIHRIDKHNLQTEEVVDVSNFVSIVHHTSHPHVMKDGTVYNLAMSLTSTGPQHSIVKFPSGKKMFEEASIVGSKPARWSFHPSYMHTFGITENYFIIVEQPLSVSLGGMVLQRLKNEPFAGCFRWYPDEKTQFSLISKETGKLVYKFVSDSFFYLHIINQFEIDNHVIIDICTYRDPAMLDCMYLNAMKKMQENSNYAELFRSKPLRFVLPLNPENGENPGNLVTLPNSTAKASYLENGDILVKPEQLSNLGCETPRINYDSHLGKKYRYFYAISADVDSDNPGTIIKIDTVSKLSKTWCEDNCYPSEPIFVPSPESKAKWLYWLQFEDDGVILSAMVWGGKHENRVGLIVLNAETLQEIGRAVFETESPVPKCLHGWFLQENE